MPRDHWREFAREIHSYGDVPESHVQALKPVLPPLDEILHMYLIPQQRGFWEWFNDTPPRNTLFILSRREVIIAKDTRSGIDLQRCDLKDLVTFEVGTILLNSWVKLVAADAEGLRSMTLEYNTVFERDFRHSIFWLRRFYDQAQAEPRHEWRMPGEEHIKVLPLKFNNAARNYWLQGESAVGACFIKPLTTHARLPLYRRIGRTYAAAKAVVLSTLQVCVIAEQGLSYSGRWGQTWHFCPLNQIARLDIVAREPFPELQISMTSESKWNECKGAAGNSLQADLAVPFAPEQRPEVELIVRKARELQKKTPTASASTVAGSVA